MSQVAQKIAENLLQIKAIKLSPQKPFTWASGKLSPIYCDNRIALSYPSIRSQIIDGFVESINSNHDAIDVIIGVATAGIPHGALVAEKLNLPFAYVRSKAKAHGRQNLIEGHIEKGWKAIVIEDLISTGGSCLTAVKAVREAGLEVSSVHAIFEYGFKIASESFKADNCPYYTLSNYETLINAATRLNYISQTDLTLLNEWRSTDQ